MKTELIQDQEEKNIKTIHLSLVKSGKCSFLYEANLHRCELSVCDMDPRIALWCAKLWGFKRTVLTSRHALHCTFMIVRYDFQVFF
jgi:hypothetical protein